MVTRATKEPARSLKTGARSRIRSQPHNPDRFRIIGMETIPVDHIIPNPHNPRPSYHFERDDPHLASLADSLKLSGQHNQCKVYELSDRPGFFSPVQGHRRYYAARLANEDTLECAVVKAPKDLAEELDWIASEDSNREPWGLYSHMRFAWQVTQAHRFEHIDDPRVAAITGLNRGQLVKAGKMFRLEDSIYAHVKAWEEYTYRKGLSDEGIEVDFVHDSGIRIAEFNPDRAALTYDLFMAMRAHCPAIVAELDDETLQHKLARVASRAGIHELQKLLSLIVSVSTNPQPGALAQVNALLDDRHPRRVADVLRSTRNVYVLRLAKTTQALDRMTRSLRILSDHTDQLGGDVELLKDANVALLTAMTYITKLQAQITATLRNMEHSR